MTIDDLTPEQQTEARALINGLFKLTTGKTMDATLSQVYGMIPPEFLNTGFKVEDVFAPVMKIVFDSLLEAMQEGFVEVQEEMKKPEVIQQITNNMLLQIKAVQ